MIVPVHVKAAVQMVASNFLINEINKKFKLTRQELTAYKIIFNDAIGELEYLKGKTVKLPEA